MSYSTKEHKEKEIVIVGGGPVGCAAALFLEKRGFKVEIYEMREDPRQSHGNVGKSINLTLSHKGLKALEKIGMKEAICDKTVECKGRIIHDRNQKTRKSLYGEKNESILSINRKGLHIELINAIEKRQNIRMYFDHKLVGMNLDKLDFRVRDSTITIKAGVILGCDGANSVIRKNMNRESYLSYKEESIEERYIELTIPPTHDNQFALDENYLHIWAREDFMMIGLPNKDRSFTVILFMPFDVFESLRDREVAKAFVHKHFEDAVPLIGEKKILDNLTGNAHPLMWVKCSRHNIGGRVLLLGDAAHAMVPFYGQGINCGFEGLTVLDELLDKHNEDFEKAFKEFSKMRTKDTDVMCDLSLENYIELKKKVNTRWLSCRQSIDSFLYRLFPNTWIPIYTMVAFSEMRYSECDERRKWQDKIIKRSLYAGLVLVVAMVIGLFSRAYQQQI